MPTRRWPGADVDPRPDDAPEVHVRPGPDPVGTSPDPDPVVVLPAAAAVPRASLLVPLLVGAAVAVTMGVYGRVHAPTGIAVNLAGFSSPQAVKVWLGSGAAAFAVLQLLSALAMWGRLGGFSPPWAAAAHRWSGRVAFLLTVPVAVHCLYALGFADHDLRTLVHSLLGCLFFGAFTTKMLALAKPGVAGWFLPVVGGVVFTVLMGIWLTSSLWYFTTVGVGT